MNNLPRDYKMSDGKLVDVNTRMLIGANRDIAELMNFGYTQQQLDDMEAEALAFMQMPTDIELSSMMAEATEAKNALRTEATDFVMVEVMARVALEFGADSRAYDRFGASEIHSVSDPEFPFLLFRVHRQTVAKAAQLATRGLTPVMVAQVEAYANAFIQARKAQGQAIDDRDVAVQDRVEAGNALYSKIVALGDLGKRLWLNRSESHYNDYVIYQRTASPEAQEVTSEVAAASTVNLSVTGVTATTQLEFNNTGSAPLELYFSTLPLEPGSPSGDMVQLPPGASWAGQASEAGFMAGTAEYLNVRNTSPVDDGHIEVLVH